MSAQERLIDKLNQIEFAASTLVPETRIMQALAEDAREAIEIVQGMASEFTPKPEERLTKEERAVLQLLADAWDSFAKLPVQHPMHKSEFAQAVHVAQRLVMSRVVARQEGWIKDEHQ